MNHQCHICKGVAHLHWMEMNTYFCFDHWNEVWKRVRTFPTVGKVQYAVESVMANYRREDK